jgi:hypothetical protein
MRTLQNQDAVMYFVLDVFPLVKKAVPDTFFHIIGTEPPQCRVTTHIGHTIPPPPRLKSGG